MTSSMLRPTTVYKAEYTLSAASLDGKDLRADKTISGLPVQARRSVMYCMVDWQPNAV